MDKRKKAAVWLTEGLQKSTIKPKTNSRKPPPPPPQRSAHKKTNNKQKRK